MTTITCSECSFENQAQMQFCQNCGVPLSAEVALCFKCGSSNAAEAEFCGTCGDKLFFTLSPKSIAKWRGTLGGQKGWSPIFKADKKVQISWAKLDPPLLPGSEDFLFRKQMTIPSVKIGGAPGKWKIMSIAHGNEKISSSYGIFGQTWAFLLATGIRLVGYTPKKTATLQILYNDIESVSASDNRQILQLFDGSKASIVTNSDKTFEPTFAQFFRDVIEEHRQKRPSKFGTMP